MGKCVMVYDWVGVGFCTYAGVLLLLCVDAKRTAAFTVNSTRCVEYVHEMSSDGF